MNLSKSQRSWAFLGVSALALGVVSLSLTMTDDSGPGDLLYPLDQRLDRLSEDRTVNKSADEQMRYYLSQAGERLDEIQSIVNKDQNVSWLGVIKIAQAETETPISSALSEAEKTLADLIDNYSEAIEKARLALLDADDDSASDYVGLIKEFESEIDALRARLDELLLASDPVEGILLETAIENTEETEEITLNELIAKKNEAYDKVIEKRIAKRLADLEAKLTEDQTSILEADDRSTVASYLDLAEAAKAAGDWTGAYQYTKLAKELIEAGREETEDENRSEAYLQLEAAEKIQSVSEKLDRITPRDESGIALLGQARAVLTAAREAFEAGNYIEAKGLAKTAKAYYEDIRDQSKSVGDEAKNEENNQSGEDEQEDQGENKTGNEDQKLDSAADSVSDSGNTDADEEEEQSTGENATSGSGSGNDEDSEVEDTNDDKNAEDEAEENTDQEENASEGEDTENDEDNDSDSSDEDEEDEENEEDEND